MEIIIKIKTFSDVDLERLRDILENNQIIKIYYDFKSEEKIKIEYKKHTIKFNKNLSWKIRLIRNKYYKQLLNIINILETAKVYGWYCDSFFRITHLEKITDLSYYKNLLKMTLINFIGTYNFDNIFELTKDQMLTLREYKCNLNNQNDDSEDLIRLLGLYCSSTDRVFELLESEIDETMLEEMKKCNRLILICPELITEFCTKHFELFTECDINNVFELYTIIFNKVLVHEIGHAVFDYKSDFENERRANYFASLTFDGTFDEFIKIHTDIQGGEYKNPYLLNDDISTITKDVYCIN